MKILAIGASIVDIIYQVPHLPVKGGDVYIKSITKMVGGCAFNVANILKLFASQYDLLTPIGHGENGLLIKQTYQQQGHPILIEEKDQDNGFCLALVTPDGERTFITQVGIEDEFYDHWLAKVNFKKYDSYYIDGYRLFSPDSYKIVNHLLQINRGKIIYFAPGPMITELNPKLLARFFQLKPIVHLNKQEICDFTQFKELAKAAAKLANLTNNLVLITDGANGCYYYEKNKLIHVEGFKTKVVDTIGAGDVHIGAFIVAKNWRKTNNEALVWANQIAAKAVSIKGTNFDKAMLKEK